MLGCSLAGDFERGFQAPGQSEVSDMGTARGIEQDVGGLEVAMYHAPRMRGVWWTASARSATSAAAARGLDW